LALSTNSGTTRSNQDNLELPLKEIAEDIGISPEALSRGLRELQREGVITRTRKKIIFRPSDR
jgi:DNA-binding Lrp family transcriptional regulator